MDPRYKHYVEGLDSMSRFKTSMVVINVPVKTTGVAYRIYLL